MLLKEMLAYFPGLNVDRLVAFSALIAFAKVQQSNRGYLKRTESNPNKSLEKSENLYKLKYSPFKNLERGGRSMSNKPKRSAFKNYK
jgi:Ser/Thr protein kinase RdoA (MazF antagonist)